MNIENIDYQVYLFFKLSLPMDDAYEEEVYSKEEYFKMLREDVKEIDGGKPT